MTERLELFIHVGPHRTGSTYVQRACAQHRGALQRSGVAYPRPGTEFPPGHHNIAWLVRGRRLHGTGAATLRAGLQSAVTALRASPLIHTVFLSSEEFVAASPDAIAALLGLFGDAHARAIYVRRTGPRYVASLWQNMVQHGYAGSLDTTTRTDLEKYYRYDPLDPDGVTATWETATGNPVALIEYGEGSADPQRLLGEVTGVGGFAVDGPSAIANASLTTPEIELIRAANMIARQSGRRPRAQARQIAVRVLQGRAGGELLDFAASVCDRDGESVDEALTERWGIEPPSPGEHPPRYVPGRLLFEALQNDQVPAWEQIKQQILELPEDIPSDDPAPARQRLTHLFRWPELRPEPAQDRLQEPVRYLCIVAMPRTGSSYLCAQLRRVIGPSAKYELFHPQAAYSITEDEIDALNEATGASFTDSFDPELRTWLRSHPRAALEQIRRVHGPDALVTFKVFPEHLRLDVLSDQAIGPPDTQCLLVRRRLIDSYISLMKAEQLGKHINIDTTDQRVILDAGAFASYAAHARAWYTTVANAIRSHGKQAHSIDYEAFAALAPDDGARAIAQKLVDLGVEHVGMPSNMRPYRGHKQDREGDYHRKVANWDNFLHNVDRKLDPFGYPWQPASGRGLLRLWR